MSRVIVLILMVLMIPVFSVDVGWLSDWNYRTLIEVSNNAFEDLSNYQIKFTINTVTLISGGKMRGDCGDVRFADDDGTTIMSYWLESGCNETSTVFWIEIPLLLDSETKDIYIYYGAPTKTSTSSGSATFELFDDFNSDSIGTTWQIYDGSGLRDTATANAFVSVINSSLILNSVSNYNVITKSFKISRPTVIEGKMLFDDALNSADGKTFTLLYYDPETNLDPERSSYQVFTNSTGNSVLNSSSGSSQTYGVTSAYSVSRNTWYFQRMVIDDTNVTSQLLDGTYSELSFLTIENGDIDSKKVGIDHYDDGVSGNNMLVDWVRVRAYANVTPTVNTYSESSKPTLSYALVGSELGNMRTIVLMPSTEEHMVKIELDPLSQCSLVSAGSATMDFGTLTFNSSGYSVNGVFRWINATAVTYSENCERLSLRYSNEIGSTKTWHIVQTFVNSQLIKHIIFVHTLDSITEFNETINLDSSCSSFVNVTGVQSCSLNMHSSSGYIESVDASYCDVHWGKTPNLNLTKSVDISGGYGKSVFWESLDKNCEPFLNTFELLCGVDFENCSVSDSAPIRVSFYNNASTQKQLGRIEVFGVNGSKKINGQTISRDLIDTRYISQGLNYVELGGVGNISKVKIILSRPYTASLFFGEKPEIYRLTVKGPLTGVSTGVSGIPVTDKILKFRKLGGKTHMELGIGASTVDVDIFKTYSSFDFQDSKLYQSSGALKKISISQLPIAGSKDIQPPQLPPTHNIYSASRIFYSDNIISEVVMTAWRAI
ncbi:MAG: DUF2341 domain-containing protein [Candidatus Altiarchaeota archaeon]|nr:DUF2341 domain-containing protein [Candidatus Altiarchaeota archaeon]